MLTSFYGVILDNPKANRNALEELERRYPTWVCMGCQDHGLNLLMKDLMKRDKLPVMAPILDEVCNE